MDKLFNIFLQTNYPKFNAEISDNDRDYLKNSFLDYLKSLPECLQYIIIPKNLFEVISNVDNPIRQNGWHPALLLHFNQFVKSTEKQRKQFNAPSDEDAGVVPQLHRGSDGPKDLMEFLQCLKVDIDAIDYAKRNIVQLRNDPNSEIIQRGGSYMLESACKENLYQFVKNYLHWYL